jgi:hypothetical protein
MTNWKGRERKQLLPISRYYPGICLEVLKKKQETSVTILWHVDPLLDSARNTRSQQYRNSVFFVRGWAVAMQRVL